MKEDQTFPNNLIRIGQNQFENDELVGGSKQTDLWFHLNSFSSCHVVLSCDHDNPATNEMMVYCAQLCKLNTKYKNVPNVKVMWAPIKKVKKTDVPGKVIVSGKRQTITV